MFWCFSLFFFVFFFFFKQKTAYEIMPSLVGSEMCIRDSSKCYSLLNLFTVSDHRCFRTNCAHSSYSTDSTNPTIDKGQRIQSTTGLRWWYILCLGRLHSACHNITRSYEPTWFFLGFIQCAMDPKWHFCRNLTASTHLGDHGVGTVFQTAILSWRRSPRHRLCNLTWKTSLRVLYCCHAHSNVRGNAYFASRSRSCR